MTGAARGRPRNAEIDQRVLEVAQHHLAQHGYAAMSIVAVAEEAGTTRQAVYRRWATKADLATAAIAAMSQAEERPPSNDPFADLVAELEAFRRGVSRPDGLSMVGTMLIGSTDPDLVSLFRERVVHPRRRRLREILERARARGLLHPDADVELAVTIFTGSWYALALAGEPAPDDWALRIARLGWAALGGDAPTGQGPRSARSTRTRRT